MKRGGGETVDGCGAELGVVAPWRARSGRRREAAKGRWQRCLLWSARGGRRKLAGPVGPKRPSRPAGLLGRLGRNPKRKSFQNKNWIFQFTKALKICTRRFRRNFDVGICSKFF
jgi:hypothetical protein